MQASCLLPSHQDLRMAADTGRCALAVEVIALVKAGFEGRSS